MWTQQVEWRDVERVGKGSPTANHPSSRARGASPARQCQDGQHHHDGSHKEDGDGKEVHALNPPAPFALN